MRTRGNAAAYPAVRAVLIGNLATFDPGARVVERVPVASDDLAKRILRVSTSVGDIGLRFMSEDRAADGDVIYADDGLVIALHVVADDVLVMHPRTIAQAVEIAHALGNRHLPIQRDGETIVVRFDPLLEALARSLDVTVTREQRVLSTAFRHAHAPHSHD
jgi:urease accessory protein